MKIINILFGVIFTFFLSNIALATTPNLILGSTILIQPLTAPTSSPVPTSTPNGNAVNYPAPNVQWPNAVAITSMIDSSKAVNHKKSYDATAMNIYQAHASGYDESGGQGGINGWGSQSYFSTDTLPGAGVYYAQNSDPIYTFNYCSECGYSGYSTGIVGIHVPYGAQTTSSGVSSCDCHLYLVQPLGFIPGSTNGQTWHDVSPHRYVMEIENAATSNGCVGQSSIACTEFNGSAQPTMNYMYGCCGVMYSTGGSGFNGGPNGSHLNDGFYPDSAPSNPITGYAGSANHGGFSRLAMQISAEDILQGAINHETGLNMLCLQNSQSDVWPENPATSDTFCDGSGNGNKHPGSLPGTTSQGWAYGDHIWLDYNDATITSQVNAGTLTPLQGIYAKSLHDYGAVTMDTLGTYGCASNCVDSSPSFASYNFSGESSWGTVANSSNYNLPTINEYGYTGFLTLFALPFSYMQGHLHAIDSCAVYGSPGYNSC